MNGIYIINYDKELLLSKEFVSTGIYKKILDQVGFFKKKFKMFEIVMLKYHNQTTRNKILYRIPFYKKCYNLDLIDIKKINYNIDFIYIRRPDFFSYDFINYLILLKKKYKCKIIMEFPTYPYTKEYFKRFIDIPLLIKDIYNRRMLKKAVDRIAVLTNHRKIYGIKTIKIENGIDIKNEEYFKIYKKNSPAIKLIMVANFQYWHGIDRLLIGLGEYYKTNINREVVLDIVGTIPKQIKKKCDQIIKKYSINNYITYHGLMNNQVLSNLYKEAHIGICALGCHRKGIYRSQEIKSREYLGHLLPIVGSSVDVIKDYNFPYFKKVEENEKPINIIEIINMYDMCYDQNGVFRYYLEVIQFVKKKFSIDECMKNVVDEIKGELLYS